MMSLPTDATLGVLSHLQLSLCSGTTLGSSCSYLDDEPVYRCYTGSALSFTVEPMFRCNIAWEAAALILMMSLSTDITLGVSICISM